MAGTPVCHQMVFITCFVLTSIQYEWKSIFHLDLIVSVHWQLKAPRPPEPQLPLVATAALARPGPPCTQLYFIPNYTCLRPTAKEDEALGNYSCEDEPGGLTVGISLVGI